MKLLISVFIGGGLGSCLRYLFSKWFNSASEWMPYGTLLANVLACIVLGYGTYYFHQKTSGDESLRLFLLVGFCGGFSTFSTFSSELFQLMKSGDTFSLITYASVSLVLCNLGIAVGIWLGKSLIA